MVRGVLIGALLLAVAGCSGGQAADESGPRGESDCIAQLLWNGVSHRSSGDLVKPVVLGERLGKGRIPGCDDPGQQVNVVRIRGVSPAVAVGVDDDDWRYAWLAPGYLHESPRHPLHDAIYGSPQEPNAEDGFRCGSQRTLRARALDTPEIQYVFLQVAAEDSELEGFLVRDDVDGIVTLDANTVVIGHERDGIPFVQAGDEFSLVLRECEGKATEPGLAGVRRLVVRQLGP